MQKQIQDGYFQEKYNIRTETEEIGVSRMSVSICVFELFQIIQLLLSAVQRKAKLFSLSSK